MVLLESSMVPLGASAHDFKLLGVDDQMHALEDFSRARVLVLIFMCNHCPYVQRIWSDLVELERLSSEEVQFIGINSNANPAYPEDSFDKMKEYVEEMGQDFPYLYDEGQKVSRAYDAQCTPDFFVYDEERKLAYRGAFEGIRPAMDAILKGEKPPAQQKVSMGCSIKWN